MAKEARRPKRVRLTKPISSPYGGDARLDAGDEFDAVEGDVEDQLEISVGGFCGRLDADEYEVIEWHDSKTPAATVTA
jgi:hypothetical protein